MIRLIMKPRRIMYCFVSATYLRNRVEEISKQLEIEKDSKKRMDLIDEDFDIIAVCLWKCRKDKNYIKQTCNEFKEQINKHKKRVEESK